jgi:fimbrial isopeptide formation D2 family protein/MYXO-CTERM domain-containing protein
MRRLHTFARPFGLLAALTALGSATPAAAENPVLRHQEDLHGDVVVFGSTLAFDCGAGISAPAGSVASCAGQVNVADTAPDLYWRDGVANASITPTQARTSATLVLPPGAFVTYARLYWGALRDGAAADTNATLDWLGGPAQQIVADQSWVVPYGPAHPTWNYYQSSGDATDFVSSWGAGDFRISDVEALPLVGLDVDRAFSAWTLVVFYENPGEDLRNLALFDSFTSIDKDVPGHDKAEVTLTGFLIPQAFNARMTAFAYEGDNIYDGDHFTINGVQLSDAKNPAANFYNGSRSYLGAAVSGSQDVPKLSGEPGSMSGYDLDTVDVKSQLKPGDKSALVGADSILDIFLLGGFVTSVQSLAPDFKGMGKEVVDLDGGAVVQGDTLEYTITAVNGGNDSSKNSVLTDVIQPGLSYVPGSIEILEGGVVGVKSDQSGDDQAEYSAGAKLITVRVGTGATAATGGKVAAGATVKVRFRVKVTAAAGTVENQAQLDAEGNAGAAGKVYLSDADPQTPGDQPTVSTIAECDTNADCPAEKPHCDPTTHVCTGCVTDDDCADPALPACQPSGTCGQCSATNDKLCIGEKPVCNEQQGICVLCTLGPDGDASKCKDDPKGPVCVAGMGSAVHCGCLMDSDCGDPMSGKVCDSVTATCTDGCRGVGGNGCPTELECSSKDSSIGTCGPITSGTGGAGGAGGAGGSTGETTGGATQDPGEKGGCACALPTERDSDTPGALVGALGLLALAARRKRR